MFILQGIFRTWAVPTRDFRARGLRDREGLRENVQSQPFILLLRGVNDTIAVEQPHDSRSGQGLRT